ncbi:MATE family efflux transporter [Brevibacterium jeotgali]|uniref:Putative efflux protein, MATE family n=1 Tax=Brevibacterium jeotgali TaxID=1262550 RepID=A0A2H1L718_9MICO|nr:MATE family efflux transporter [Brevibacterium jeotgali]TWC02620.1 putative MATE family efflux protein [Brevibacterium jeotgali]SMY12530.1 putative efflux protein, MATE family [Brevibacterium jeotgali]
MKPVDREILRLAVPALGALIAEPLFLLADTAMVGHLGAPQLGGLAIASTVLQTVLGLMIFLAYATTPRVAKRMGTGDIRGAVSAGFDGMWLSVVMSALLLLAGLPLLGPVVGAFGPAPQVESAALTYLTISWWGLPFMLLVVAGTGLLRGLQDTTTPLWVAGGGFGANIVLNAILIYGLDLGIAGSAVGSVIAQAAMAVVILCIAFRAAARHGASLWPQWSGVWSSARTSGWLVVRSAALRAALILLVFEATGLGTQQLAAVQVVQTLFFAVALALDALAIAGQALIALRLGAEDVPGVQRITARLVRWGVGFGIVCALLIAAGAAWIPFAFTGDPAVRSLLTSLLLVFAVSLPLAGIVFVLDGVLLGAEDAQYLALAQVVSFAVFAVILYGAMAVWPNALTAWAAFVLGFLGARGVTLGARARGRAWIDRALARGIR